MKNLIAFASLILLAGCATPPSKIKAAAVSPAAYSAMTCDQLGAEHVRITTELEPLLAEQNRARSADVAGVVLIGLPVGSMTAKQSNDDRVAKISKLKGERQAVLNERQAKGCSVTHSVVPVHDKSALQQTDRSLDRS